jgi:glycosyltransferase involved in cell wall biosynthesis
MSAAPYFSVIVPVHDGGRDIDRCLAALRASDTDDHEIIVVDDASTDDTPRRLREAPPDVIVTLARRVDGYGARNVGAGLARGEVLVFTDADVVLRRDTLRRLRAHFADPAVGSVIGLYALEHPHDDLCSVYKNAWIRYSYLRAPERVDWFFTAIGAIRRAAWEASPRFDPRARNRIGGGDIELGRLLFLAGSPPLLDKTLDVVHHRSFDLVSLLRNDATRAYGWTRRALATGSGARRLLRGHANAGSDFVAGVALAWSLAVLLAAGAPALPAAVLAGAYGAASLPFHRFATKNLAPVTALGCVPLMFVDHLAAGVGVGLALLEHGLRAAGVVGEGSEGAAPEIVEVWRRAEGGS